MVSIARVVFQGCADKEQSNSILCQLKLLILKKQFARKKKKCISGKYIKKKILVLFKFRQSSTSCG